MSSDLVSTQPRLLLVSLRKAVFSARTALSILVVLAIALLVIPLPTLLIDIAVSVNLLLAMYLLLKTLFVKDSLELTTFPSLLLLTTVLRLAVSIATARSILSIGDAGELVRTFGEFVVGGNLVVGLVIFTVISIVQFLVITKGGERIAEVSARFTLDALPGKQMSIDADLKAGDITREEARARRKRLQSESEFFGSMDGAMRFVKGDCIATMFIVVINLVGGILVGVVGQGMSLALAAKTFSIMSVGDGLVAQIPSILSCLAAGILATRVNGDEASSDGLGGDIASQLLNEKRSLIVAAVALAALGLVPGFPPFVLLPLSGVILAGIFVPPWIKARKARQQTAINQDGLGGQATHTSPAQLIAAKFNDPIRVLANPETLNRLENDRLGNLIQDLLKNAASDQGIGIQAVKFARAAGVPLDRLIIVLEGIPKGEITLKPDLTSSEIANALVTVAKQFSAEAFGLDDTHEWLESHMQIYPKLIGNVQGQLPMPILAGVLRSILKDGLSIAHPRAMLEELLTASETKFMVDELTDVARAALVQQVLTRVAGENGRVELVEIDEESLAAIESHISSDEVSGIDEFDENEKILAVLFNRLANELRRLRRLHQQLVLVLPAEMRARLTTRLRQLGDDVPIISVLEADRIPKRVTIGKINLEPTASGG